MDAIEAGSGHGAVFDEVRETLPPEMDQDFLNAIHSEGKRRGLDIEWKHANETAPASVPGSTSEAPLDVESIRVHLQHRIDLLSIDDDHRKSLTERLKGAAMPQVRRINKEVGLLENSKKPNEVPVGGMIDGRARDVAGAEQEERVSEEQSENPVRVVSSPNARGISFGSPSKEAPIPVKESLGVHTVKENGITRLATMEEIKAFNSKPEQGPTKPGPMTDQNREYLYEMTGNAESLLLNGFAGLEKKARERVSSNVPKIKQKTAYVDESMVPPTAFRGKLSKGVRDPSQGSHDSIHHEKISNLDEILSNPRRQVMFGEFLDAQGKTDLIERYHEGQKNPSAWPISENLVLQQMLRAFDKRFAAVEAIKAGFTKGDAETFIRENTELGFMETGTNSDRAFEILRDSLDHTLMVMSQNEYEGVVDTMRKTRAIRNDYRFKAMMDRARKAVKDEGINPEDLNWETIEKNPYLLNAILSPKMLDRLFGDESSKNSKEMLDAIKFNRNVAGTLLASTIANDPLLKQRLLQEVHTRTKAPETAAQGIAAYEGVLTENEKVAALDAMKPEVWTERLKDTSFKNTIMPNWNRSARMRFPTIFRSRAQIYISDEDGWPASSRRHSAWEFERPSRHSKRRAHSNNI